MRRINTCSCQRPLMLVSCGVWRVRRCISAAVLLCQCARCFALRRGSRSVTLIWQNGSFGVQCDPLFVSCWNVLFWKEEWWTTALGLHDEILGHIDPKLGVPWLGIVFLTALPKKVSAFGPVTVEKIPIVVSRPRPSSKRSVSCSRTSRGRGGRFKPWL